MNQIRVNPDGCAPLGGEVPSDQKMTLAGNTPSHTELPIYIPLKGWMALSGMTRSGTYIALTRQYLRAIKPQGKRLLIDVGHGLAWLNLQPEVKFTPPKAS